MAAPLQLIHAFLSANIKVCLECLDPTLGCLLYDCPEDRTEVDFIPDQKNKTLRVRLHPLISEVHDQKSFHGWVLKERNSGEESRPSAQA